jgi:alkylation response protein AidB-like acyl-CoA dehydrogenase
MDPITQIEAIELLARADASAAWCAMIGCDTGYLGAFLPDTVAREVITDCTRASAFVANPTGRATPCEGGYTVSGRWTFASGSSHSQAVAVGCMVPEGEGLRMAGPAPELRVCVFPCAEVEVIDTWTTTGVRGSGSHDVAITERFVPAERTFTLTAPAMTRPEPLYRFPMLFTFKLGAVALGCARAAIDDVLELSAKKGSFGTRALIKDQEWLQVAVARAEMAYGQARAFYFESTRQAWAEMLAGNHPAPLTVARLNIAQVGASERAVEIVDGMYKAGGSASVYSKNTLDRRLRDIHTMAQHTVLGHRSLTGSGLAFLG